MAGSFKKMGTPGSPEAGARSLRKGAMRRCLVVAACAVFSGLTASPLSAQQGPIILRDTETEALLRDIGTPLAKAGGMTPGAIRYLLTADPAINAFVAGGQNIFLNSGLLIAADNVNELQGVVAHELGHIAGGHIVRSDEGMLPARNISILSFILGAAAFATGSAQAGTAAILAGQRAALGTFLTYSRDQESAADQAGVRFLRDTGVSARGSLRFFRKLQSLEIAGNVPQADSFLRTHPLNQERIAALEEVSKSSPYWDKPIDPRLESRFERVKAKLTGYIEDPARTLRLYPPTDHSDDAHYARAYAWHKSSHLKKALAEADALLARHPDDPYYLELKGQILLETGNAEQALDSLRRAVTLTHDEDLIATMFAHALISTEDARHIPEAIRILKPVVERNGAENPFAWYQLGIAFDQVNDAPRAAWATAERAILLGDYPIAQISARRALAGLPKGSPERLRSQDILLASQAVLKDRSDQKGERKRPGLQSDPQNTRLSQGE